jgi:hypothetical protein
MSALPQKRTSPNAIAMSALLPEADQVRCSKMTAIQLPRQQWQVSPADRVRVANKAFRDDPYLLTALSTASGGGHICHSKLWNCGWNYGTV